MLVEMLRERKAMIILYRKMNEEFRLVRNHYQFTDRRRLSAVTVWSCGLPLSSKILTAIATLLQSRAHAKILGEPSGCSGLSKAE
jgi:hypothetical protein